MSEEKKRQLGMAPGTARNKLVKRLMFKLAQKCSQDICFQCEERIEDFDELSIEHKIPWLHSDNPVRLYFDLDNVCFSHLCCNNKAARSDHRKKHGKKRYEKGCRCDICIGAKRKSTRESNRRIRGTNPENFRV